MKKMKNISVSVFVLSLALVFFASAFLTLLFSLEINHITKEKSENDSFLISEMPEVEARYSDTLGVKCFDGWENWKSSTEFKTDAAWSTAFMASNPISPNPGSTSNQYGYYYYFDFKTDINGDGLPDYVYAYHNSNFAIQDCVYLSNGQGWTLAYRCVFGDNKFYGDCAG